MIFRQAPALLGMTFLPKNGSLPNCPNPLAIRTASFTWDLLRWPDAFLKSWLPMDFELWKPGSFLHFWTDHQPCVQLWICSGWETVPASGRSGRRNHALAKHGAHSLQVWRDWLVSRIFLGHKNGTEPSPCGWVKLFPGGLTPHVSAFLREIK